MRQDTILLPQWLWEELLTDSLICEGAPLEEAKAQAKLVLEEHKTSQDKKFLDTMTRTISEME